MNIHKQRQLHKQLKIDRKVQEDWGLSGNILDFTALGFVMYISFLFGLFLDRKKPF